MTARSATTVIGLTGPIGCGKSTVAGWLADEGAIVIDADAVARAVTEPGTAAHDAVLATFGAAVQDADGHLDRRALARIVFGDPAALARLEAIVHPAVRPEIERRLAAARDGGVRVAAIEAIKLVEGGLARSCDEVWLVVCNERDQRQRLAARGMEPDDAERRRAAQADVVARIGPQATRVLDTSGPPDAARARMLTLLADALAARA